MTGRSGVSCGGGLGAVPGGPQKSAVVVSGRRPAFLAPFVPTTKVPISDANEVDPQVVQNRDHRSSGILVRPSPRRSRSEARR
jgi:hypothetical protein